MDKIAEIREALEKIDRGDFSEIAGAHEKSGEWLRFLLDELERERAELDRLKREIESHGPEGRNYTNQQVVELRLERERLIEENRKLREERDEARSKAEEAWKEIDSLEEQLLSAQQDRDKLIEGLRWYAKKDTHEIKRRPDGDYAPIVLDHGQRARDILKEIGVTDV